jgi:hypothetical protein
MPSDCATDQIVNATCYNKMSLTFAKSRKQGLEVAGSPESSTSFEEETAKLVWVYITLSCSLGPSTN